MNLTPTQHADGIIGHALYELAIARGALAAFDADGDVMKVYVSSLNDLDPELIERACHDLRRLERREYDTALPSVGAIRERAAMITRELETQQAQAKLLPAPRQHPDEPVYFCLDCKDETSAWAERYCIGVGDLRVVGPSPHGSKVEPCGRPKTHPPHPFVVRCSCYDTNPVSAKRRDLERVRRDAYESKKRR